MNSGHAHVVLEVSEISLDLYCERVLGCNSTHEFLGEKLPLPLQVLNVET